MMRIVYIQTVRWWNIVQNAKELSQQRCPCWLSFLLKFEKM